MSKYGIIVAYFKMVTLLHTCRVSNKKDIKCKFPKQGYVFISCDGERGVWSCGVVSMDVKRLLVESLG